VGPYSVIRNKSCTVVGLAKSSSLFADATNTNTYCDLHHVWISRGRVLAYLSLDAIIFQHEQNTNIPLLAQMSVGHHNTGSWSNSIFVDRHQFVDYDTWLYFFFWTSMLHHPPFPSVPLISASVVSREDNSTVDLARLSEKWLRSTSPGTYHLLIYPGC